MNGIFFKKGLNARNHINDELKSRCHGSLEEVDDDRIESVFQSWISSERLLFVTPEVSCREIRAKVVCRKTHNLRQYLGEDSDEFVVHQLAAFDAWLFEPLDLLLDDDFECLGANE